MKVELTEKERDTIFLALHRMRAYYDGDNFDSGNLARERIEDVKQAFDKQEAMDIRKNVQKSLEKNYRAEKAEEAKRLDDFESVFEYGTSKKSIRAHPIHGLKSNRGQGGYFTHRKEHSINRRKAYKNRGR